MTELDALADLLVMVNASTAGVGVISSDQVANWPATARSAMTRQTLLKKARTAQSAICPGCERQCAMPVQSQRSFDTVRLFIVCDKRSDINRVTVSVESLEQWRCDLTALREFIGADLELRLSERDAGPTGVTEIGVARGKRRIQLLALRTSATLELVAGTASIPLADAFTFLNGNYGVDRTIVQQLVDRSTSGDPQYTPSTLRRETRKLETNELHEEWRRLHRELIEQRPGMSKVWYSQQVAKRQAGKKRSAQTIRKHLRD